jgi:hypothetical protein
MISRCSKPAPLPTPFPNKQTNNVLYESHKSQQTFLKFQSSPHKSSHLPPLVITLKFNASKDSVLPIRISSIKSPHLKSQKWRNHIKILLIPHSVIQISWKSVLEEISAKTESFACHQKNTSSMKKADVQDVFNKASKSICRSRVVLFPDTLKYDCACMCLCECTWACACLRTCSSFFGIDKVILNPYLEYPAAISLSFIGLHLTTTCTASLLCVRCGCKNRHLHMNIRHWLEGS